MLKDHYKESNGIKIAYEGYYTLTGEICNDKDCYYYRDDLNDQICRSCNKKRIV